MSFDLLLTNGALLTAAAPCGFIASGYVGIKDGIIREIGEMNALIPGASARERLDTGGDLIMPGLVNTHTHAAMTLFRGLADDLPLMIWLQKHIFPAEARYVNPEMVYWATKLAAAEMILSGTTCVADSYFFADAAARAFCDTGLRAVSCQGVIDFPAPGVPDPQKNVAVAARFIARWQNENPLLLPGVFCHSAYTCSPETLCRAKALAVDRGTLFFIHVAESREELAIIKERHKATPVEHLARLGVLDPGTVCVHGVWLTPPDLDLLQTTGARVAVCPASHMKLASGTAPVRDILARKIRMGLGTDGCASNNNLDLFKEMDLCAKLQKAIHHNPSVLPAAEVLDLAMGGGAGVLGLESQIGSLEAGKKADLVVIGMDKPHLTPWYGSASHLAYAARGADVQTVVIDGRLVMSRRRIISFNVEEAMREVEKLARAVKASA